VLSVRKFKPTDIFSIIKISADSLTERYNPNLFNYFYESFQDGFLVCEINYRIVGFIIGIKTNSEIARILMLAVSNQHRKKGIGSFLLKNFLREMVFKNIKLIELEVKKSNISAINFYQKHGFEIIDILSKFYQNNEDAYIMRLII
jgi:ribosomal-protein-alanine N-acetyltransferase